MSAAHSVLQAGGNVLVLDKNPFFGTFALSLLVMDDLLTWIGGNSTKATSGINGALTRTQIALGIPDNVSKFYDDTLKSARDLARPELIKVLTYKSAAAVEWLQDVFNLDLSLVSRLGGHSEPRTHRGKEMFPGMVITYALMEALEDIAENTPERAEIIKKARVTKVLREGDKSVGVEYMYDGKSHKAYGPVILATGGYAADFQKGGLLEQHRPDLLELSTTNGDHCTGDGQKMVFPSIYVTDGRSWLSEERVLTWIKFKSIQLVSSIPKTPTPKSSSLPPKPSVVSVVSFSIPEEIDLSTNSKNVMSSPTQCGNVTNSP